MRFFITYSLAAVLSLGLLAGIIAAPTPVQAATFEPGTLIPDSLFVAPNTMSAGDIQDFLTQKGSVLANLSSEYLGANANGRSASQIIYDASRATITDYGAAGRPSNPFSVSINPQVLLVTLQKETSLITGNYTVGSSTLNNMLRIAMGMGCPDSGGCDPFFEGFTNQLTYGSAQLYLNYWRAQNNIFTTNPTFKVGDPVTTTGNQNYAPYCSSANMTFTVGNAATASLYRYTPHTCNGNANFWYYINHWFPARVNSFLSDSRLLRVDGDPAVYAYWPSKNKRWHVVDPAAKLAWGLDNKPIELTAGVVMDSIPLGNGHLGVVSRGLNTTEVFYMERSYKRYIRNYASLYDRGLSEHNVTVVDDMVISEYFEGPPLGGFARESSSPDIYLTSWAWKFYIDDFYTINNFGFSDTDVRVIEPGSSDLWTGVSSIEWLVRQYDHPDVFLVSNGQKHYVPSGAILRHWGFTTDPVRDIGPDIMNQLPRAQTLTRVAKGSGSEVYVVENGKRRYVRSWARLKAAGFKSTDLMQVSDPILYRLPLGSPL